jgi:predicted nucleotidyltransferase component of viral defense system
MAAGLTEHLRREARRVGIEQAKLRRQFAYDRLLARVFADGGGDWVLKGGTALLARIRTARHTMDIDLFRRSGNLETAVDHLRMAVVRDLGDNFRFELSQPRAHTATDQAKVSVEAFIGTHLFERFSIDIVVGSILTTEPEVIKPSLVIEFDGLTPPDYLLYPVVDHIADKLCATFEFHGQSGKLSSRFRDLVDLVVLARTQAVDAAQLNTAIETERLHRGLPSIDAFAVPPAWSSQYPSAAKEVARCAGYRTLPEALALMARFLDPVLSGAVDSGRWSTNVLEWQLSGMTSL